MTRADRVRSTPPTSTPIDTRRRCFLSFAAGASVLAVSAVASLAQAPACSAPGGLQEDQTVALPNPELLAALSRLQASHSVLIRAQAANEEARAMWEDWEVQNPQPASKRDFRKWIRKGNAYHNAVIAESWRALITAEVAFIADQNAIAVAPITGPADVRVLAAASVIFDAVELCCTNRAPIARSVAGEVARLGKVVLA